jgi:hypothetical protein
MKIITRRQKIKSVIATIVISLLAIAYIFILRASLLTMFDKDIIAIGRIAGLLVVISHMAFMLNIYISGTFWDKAERWVIKWIDS